MVKVKRDLTGMVFGRLTVIKQAEDYIGTNGKHRARWLCKCNCDKGTEVVVMTYHLTSGNMKSCGCYRKENSHGVKKYNDYEVQEDYVIMYTSKKEPFLVDLDDFWKVKNICWRKDNKGYVIGNVNGKTTGIHHLIMDCPDGLEVDHIHGVQTRNDNRKYNLRIVTRNQNNTNRRKPKNNTSGTTGVYWNRRLQKWCAYIYPNKKTIYLGSFNIKDDAINARKEAENKYYGEFSYDNSQKLANSS